MKPSSLSIFILLAAPWWPAAHASLSLNDALARTAAQNPQLLALAAHERAATALIDQAGARPNPTLDVTLENFAGTGTARGVDTLESTVELSQTFERGGKRAKRTTLATRERDVAAAEFAVKRAEVLAAAASAYLDAIVARQRLALAAEPLQLARDTLAAAEARIQAGAASPVEAARARAAIASAQAEFARAQSTLAAARAALAASWGGSASDLGEFSSVLGIPENLPAETTFLDALARHPRLDLQQALVAGRRASLELEQAKASQDVSIGGGVRFLRESRDAALVAGVSVPLPVRNKNQGGIRAAREILAGAEQSTRAVENELRAAFTAAWQELSSAHATAQSLRRDALPATADAYAVVQRAYQEGQLPLIDVLDAQRALTAIRREILDAEAAYAHALARAEALANPTFPATSALLSFP